MILTYKMVIIANVIHFCCVL